MFFNLLNEPTVWYPILFDTPHNIVRSVAIYLTVVLGLVFIITLLVRKSKGLPTDKFFKISLIVAIIYSAIVIITFFVFSYVENGIVPILFIPLVILILSIAVCSVLLAVKKTALIKTVFLCVVGASVIAVLVCIAIHFASGKGAELNFISNEDVNSLALYLLATIAIAVVILTALVFGKTDKSGFSTKSITYGAICIAMSFALFYLSIVKMPQGGAITIASLLPIMIYSYIFGVKKGVIIGVIYGLLQAVQDTYILHPAQFVLDYPVAFACIGLAGLFANMKHLKNPQLQFICGAIVAGVGRFIMHFIAGIFAFGAFAPEGQPVALYSLTYNATLVFPDILICIIVGLILFSSKSFRHVIDSIRNKT